MTLAMPKITVKQHTTHTGRKVYRVTIHDGPGHHGEGDSIHKALTYAAHAWGYWHETKGGDA